MTKEEYRNEKKKLHDLLRGVSSLGNRQLEDSVLMQAHQNVQKLAERFQNEVITEGIRRIKWEQRTVDDALARLETEFSEHGKGGSFIWHTMKSLLETERELLSIAGANLKAQDHFMGTNSVIYLLMHRRDILPTLLKIGFDGLKRIDKDKCSALIHRTPFDVLAISYLAHAVDKKALGKDFATHLEYVEKFSKDINKLRQQLEVPLTDEQVEEWRRRRQQHEDNLADLTLVDKLTDESMDTYSKLRKELLLLKIALISLEFHQIRMFTNAYLKLLNSQKNFQQFMSNILSPIAQGLQQEAIPIKDFEPLGIIKGKIQAEEKKYIQAAAQANKFYFVLSAEAPMARYYVALLRDSVGITISSSTIGVKNLLYPDVQDTVVGKLNSLKLSTAQIGVDLNLFRLHDYKMEKSSRVSSGKLGEQENRFFDKLNNFAREAGLFLSTEDILKLKKLYKQFQPSNDNRPGLLLFPLDFNELKKFVAERRRVEKTSYRSRPREALVNFVDQVHVSGDGNDNSANLSTVALGTDERRGVRGTAGVPLPSMHSSRISWESIYVPNLSKTDESQEKIAVLRERNHQYKGQLAELEIAMANQVAEKERLREQLEQRATNDQSEKQHDDNQVLLKIERKKLQTAQGEILRLEDEIFRLRGRVDGFNQNVGITIEEFQQRFQANSKNQNNPCIVMRQLFEATNLDLNQFTFTLPYVDKYTVREKRLGVTSAGGYTSKEVTVTTPVTLKLDQMIEIGQGKQVYEVVTNPAMENIPSVILERLTNKEGKVDCHTVTDDEMHFECDRVAGIAKSGETGFLYYRLSDDISIRVPLERIRASGHKIEVIEAQIEQMSKGIASRVKHFPSRGFKISGTKEIERQKQKDKQQGLPSGSGQSSR